MAEENENKKVNVWKILAISFGIMLIISCINLFSGASQKEVKTKVQTYLDSLPLNAKAAVGDVVKDHGLYKVDIDIAGQKIEAYASKDGDVLFTSAIDLTLSPVTSATTAETKKTCEDIKKSDEPLLEAFIVSYCPFGVQMQRILAEIPLKDNIKVRYLGSIVNNKITAMHGEQEAQENLKQICIREEQSDKYWDYISCFIKEGKSEECLSRIDTQKLDSCMSGKGIDYAEEDFALQDKYGVSGSPTLALDGEKVSEFDFGGRTAEAVKTLLCCGFTKQPEACSEKLAETQAATSFSAAYSSGSTATASSCG